MRSWDLIYRTRGEVQKEVLPKIKKVVSLLKKNKVKRILDLGCGTGRHTIFLAKKDFNVTGIDISSTALNIIRVKLKKNKIRNVKLKRHDMDYIPFSNNYFDAVVCTGVLSHGKVDKIRKTVKEIHRVLKRGGFLITDTLSTKDPDYGTGKEIEHDTFLGLEEEEDIPHHYYIKKEILDMFSAFKNLKVIHKTIKISYKKRKSKAAYWDIFGIK